jgi:predicted kinase
MKLDIKNLPQPWVLTLIGPPMSGKDFWIKQNFDLNEIVMISRDQILLDVYGSDNYDEAFKNVNQKEVDRVLISTIQKASKENKNVIINMTNMTRKRRMYNLDFFGDEYYKVAVIFPILDEAEYERRNLKRKEEEQKFIPTHVLKNMISSYQSVDKSSEGFDKIVSL